MLGHMDSIKRGEVLVIAATNRLGSLDPALTRPGRFDKSIAFFHPKEDGRKSILRIHTSKWKRGKEGHHLDDIAKRTEGYTGADLEQLCRQTFLCAIRRQFPNQGSDKIVRSEYENFDVLQEDWNTALKTIKPNKTTASVNAGKALNTPGISKLISGIQKEILQKLSPFLGYTEQISGIKSFLVWDSGASQSRSALDTFIIPSLIGSAELKETRTFTLGEGKVDSSSLTTVIGQVLSCQQPAILYIPRIDKIDEKFAPGDMITPRLFLEHLESLRGEDVVVLASSSCPASELTDELRPIFKGILDSRSYKLRPLQKTEIREFFVPNPILEDKFPCLLDRVECLTKDFSIYDILDIKAELSQACADKGKDDDVALVLSTILDNFAGNKLTLH